MNMRTKFEIRSFTCSWDNRDTQNIWAVLEYAHASYVFFQIFNGFCSDGPCECSSQIWSPYIALPVPEIIATGLLGWVATPKSWGRGGHRGSGMVPFERALMSSYRPSIVTFPLSQRLSKILPLLCSSTPLLPTPLLVSPKFPHVPLGIAEWSLGYEERRCWANCPCN